jgi:hypothetical protein
MHGFKVGRSSPGLDNRSATKALSHKDYIPFFVPSCLVYLSQEIFFMFFREAGKIIFIIALVTENVTLSNPGI